MGDLGSLVHTDCYHIVDFTIAHRNAGAHELTHDKTNRRTAVFLNRVGNPNPI